MWLKLKRIRAYKYFLMNWWYGGVPIISSYSSADEAKVNVIRKQEVRDYIAKGFRRGLSWDCGGSGGSWLYR